MPFNNGSGFNVPPTSAAPGVPFTLPAGSNTNAAATAGYSTPAPVSGTPFTPNATTDCMLYLNLVFTTVGTWAITMGPSSGSEHVIAPTLNAGAVTGEQATLRVPAGWKVVCTLTGTTVAFGTCAAVAC